MNDGSSHIDLIRGFGLVYFEVLKFNRLVKHPLYSCC